MAYGDYNGPDKDDKGHEGGSCNRTLCQAPDAIWYSYGSLSWYCADCRHEIENDIVNKRDWALNFEQKCGHPMFETREMMDDREQQQRDDREAALSEAYHTRHLDGLREIILENEEERYQFPEFFGTETNANSGRKAREQVRAATVEAGVLKETRQQRRARERDAAKGR